MEQESDLINATSEHTCVEQQQNTAAVFVAFCCALNRRRHLRDRSFDYVDRLARRADPAAQLNLVGRYTSIVSGASNYSFRQDCSQRSVCDLLPWTKVGHSVLTGIFLSYG